MSISSNFPTLRPTLLLDFANSGRLDPRVTFTRASTATYFDETGVLRTAAIDTPRFDYDPDTLAARGFLIEESRTNSIRNNTMQGAVAGTPGTNPTNWSIANVLNGIAKEIVGTGTTNGITWIDVRFSGTATATGSTVAQPENVTAITAATGQSWSASAWWAISGGSTANITAINQRVTGRSAAGGLLENTDTAVTLTSTLTRYAVSRTMVNASTERVTNDLIFAYNSGAAIDITLRIGLPQLELGAFATSVIPTTTTALTRSADVASVNTLSPWYRADEGTLFVDSTVLYTVPTTSFPNSAAFTDGSNNNRLEVGYLTSTVASVASVVGGVNQSPIFPSISVSNRRTAFAYKVDDFAACSNGGAVGTDTSGTLPTVDRLNIGSNATSNRLNGYLRRITYYPRRLSNAELQSITA